MSDEQTPDEIAQERRAEGAENTGQPEAAPGRTPNPTTDEDEAPAKREDKPTGGPAPKGGKP